MTSSQPGDGGALGTAGQQLLLCVALFGAAYAANTVAPLLVFYTEDLHLTTTTLTWFFTAYAVGLMVAFLFIGALSDKLGRKVVVLPSAALLVVAVLALLGAAALGPPLILIGRFIQGFAGGAVYAVGTVWLRELAGTEHAASAAMRATASMAAGFGVGPLIGGVLVQWLPDPKILLLLIAVVTTSIAVMIVLRLPETMTQRRSGAIPFGLPPHTGLGFLYYLAPCALLVYTFVMLAMIAFPVQLDHAGFKQVYFIQGVSLLLVLGMATVATRWARRLGGATAGWVAGICGAIGCGLGYLAVQPHNWPWILPASVIIGIGSGMSITSGVMVSDELAPAASRGQLLSMFYIVAYIGFSSPTLLSLAFGRHTMDHGSTILGLGVAALIITAILAGPGRALVRRRGLQSAPSNSA
ncbi:MAG TPA: MFS transporter [Nevskiaceae bacterium]|nr:MFS transporter [Nevskiaceae bacterium]